MRIGEEQDKEAGPEPLEVPIPKRGETRYRMVGDEQIEPIVAASEYDAALDMITDEMVERAAQALWMETCSRRSPRDDYAGYPYERLIEVTKEDLRFYARAALEAAFAGQKGAMGLTEAPTAGS